MSVNLRQVPEAYGLNNGPVQMLVELAQGALTCKLCAGLPVRPMVLSGSFGHKDMST